MNETLDTLDVMRQELADFKAMLRQQRIVNEKIMRRAVQKDYSTERRRQMEMVILSLFLTPFAVIVVYSTHLFPLWFILFTAVFMSICILQSSYGIYRYISDDMMTGNLVDVARNVAAYKRYGNRSLAFFGLPVLAVWLVTFFYLIAREAGDLAVGMSVGGCIGFVAGSAAGLWFYLDSQRRVKRILQQIEEVKGCMEE